MIWKEVRENEKFSEATNFTEHLVCPYWRTKNKRPKVSNIDGSLMMRFDFEQLSTNRNYTAMERIHSISHFCANDGPRPKPLNSNYPYIALLVDSTFIVAEGLRKRKSTLYAQKLGSVSRHITLKSVVYMIISVIYWRKKSNSQRCLIGQYSAIVVTLVLILSWSVKMIKNPRIDRNAELGRIRVPVWEIKKIV